PDLPRVDSRLDYLQLRLSQLNPSVRLLKLYSSSFSWRIPLCVSVLCFDNAIKTAEDELKLKIGSSLKINLKEPLSILLPVCSFLLRPYVHPRYAAVLPLLFLLAGVACLS